MIASTMKERSDVSGGLLFPVDEGKRVSKMEAACRLMFVCRSDSDATILDYCSSSRPEIMLQ